MKNINGEIKSQELNDNFSELDNRQTSTEQEIANARNDKASLKERIDYVENQSNAAVDGSRLTDNTVTSTKIKTTTDADKIGLAELKQEVKDAMAGTTTVNSTPGAESVTTETIAPNAVSEPKLSGDLINRVKHHGFNFIGGFDKIKYIGGSSYELTWGRIYFMDGNTLDGIQTGTDVTVGSGEYLYIDLDAALDAEGNIVVKKGTNLNQTNVDFTTGRIYPLFANRYGIPKSYAMGDVIYGGHIQDGSIGNEHMANDAISTQHIKDGAVSDNKLTAKVESKLKKTWVEISGSLNKANVTGSGIEVSFPALNVFIGANAGVTYYIEGKTDYLLPNNYGLYADLSGVYHGASSVTLTLTEVSNIASTSLNTQDGYWQDDKFLIIANKNNELVGALAHNLPPELIELKAISQYPRADQVIFKADGGTDGGQVEWDPTTNTLSWPTIVFITDKVSNNRIKLLAGSYQFTESYEVCYLDLNDVVSGEDTPASAVKGGRYYGSDSDIYTGNLMQLPLYAFYNSNYHFPVGNFPEPQPIAPLSKFQQNEIVVKKTSGNIDFYIKGTNPKSDKYLKYSLKHFVVPHDGGATGNSNSNLWRLYEGFEVLRTGEYEFLNDGVNAFGQIINAGEWECAIHEVGQPDFMGGYHGDEVLTTVTLLVDGVEKDLTTTENIRGEHVKFVQVSKLYQCNTQTEVADHIKVYDISKDGIKLHQKIKWLAALDIDDAYLAMLPIKRLQNDTSGKQVTDRAFTNYDYIVDDVSVEGFSGGVNTKRHGITQANIWGSTSGIAAELTIEPKQVLPNSEMNISNATQYNKLYFDFSGVHTTAVNEEWEQTSYYKITTSN